ncbi:hypothetical protein [Cellulomonas sp. A375-1]|uniref:hypothetical protein n=1 Tax=Cellulomonas sp. A375-1 TaxID=1672219 RepID=UPI00069DCFD5|nr:hypothetical protein [Cellulomonas sp. A375-1]
MTTPTQQTAHVQYTGGDPAAGLTELRTVIEHAITNQPRSLQTRIGPSEIGTPCDHCLAAKLAGWAKNQDGIPWLPWIGTAVHAQLEDVIRAHDNATYPRNARRFIAEGKTMVGHIGGREIWGSTDLLDLFIGMTVDWKIVGETTLRAARRHGPSEVYRVQADLYAKGWNDAGYRVDYVAIAYLPRNAVTLDQAVWWSAPHDRGRAERALERANQLHANLTALATLGDAAVTAWIGSLPRATGCFDCARYPDRPAGITAPGHTPGHELDGLIPTIAA